MTTRADVTGGQETRNAPTSAIRRPVRIDQRPMPVPLTAGVTLGKVTSPDSVARAAEKAILRVAQNTESRLQQLERRSQDDNLHFMSRREASSHVALDPRLQSWVFDDFVGPTGVTMDGLAGFSSQVNGIGAANTAVAGSAARLGVVEGTTGASSSGYAALMGHASSIGLGLGRASFHSSLYLPVLSTSSERYIYRAGLLDTLSGTPVDGVYFQYTDNVQSGHWTAVTMNNSSSTINKGPSAVAATTWYALEIRIDGPAERVEFLVDDNVIAVHTTNIPNTAGREMGLCAQSILKTVGATARVADVDYCGFRVDFLNTR